MEILHEGLGYVAVLKPGGLLTQAPPEIDSMEEQVRDWLWQRAEERGESIDRPYVGIPHRLDRPASGVMLFGIMPRATKRLAEQFEKRVIQKTYWAIVRGSVDPEHGTWSDYMRKIPELPQSEIVPPDHPDAQFARLKYRTLAQLDGASLLEIELETGRTHQIRLQTSSRGNAIFGDQQYGSSVEFGPQTTDQRMRWIALHARRIRFQEPTDFAPSADGSKRQLKQGSFREIIAPLPECWREIPLLAGLS